MRRALDALGSVPSIVTAGVSVVLAVVLQSWWFLGIGAAAVAALAAADAAGARKRRATSPPALDRVRVADAQVAAAVEAVVLARREVSRAVDATTPPTLAGDLAPILAQVDDLDTRARTLAARADEISAYLRTRDVGQLRREADALTARARSATDEAARAHYLAAGEARTAQIETLAELARSKERVLATMLSIAATLDALATKIVRLRGLDGAAADATTDVRRDLAAMNEELASFEETLLEMNRTA